MSDGCSPEGEFDSITRRTLIKTGVAATLGAVGIGAQIASAAESDSTDTTVPTTDRVITGHNPPDVEPAVRVDGGPLQKTNMVSVPPGTPVTLTPQVVEGTTSNWQWSDGTTGRERTVTPTETETYTVYFDYESPYGPSPIEFTVLVNSRSTTTENPEPKPTCTPVALTPELRVDGGPIRETTAVTVAPGTPVTLSPQPDNPWAWEWADGTTDRKRTVEPTETTTYTARYTGTCATQDAIEYTIHVDEGPPWPEDATDPNDDGLYEDLSGDGRINFPDVNIFFNNADRQRLADNWEYFDFQEDGKPNLQDVMALFHMV